MKLKKLNKTSDLIVSLAMITIIFWIFSNWSQLTTEIPLFAGKNNARYIEKDSLVGILIFFTIFHIVLGILSRFPNQLKMLWIVTDQNRESQIRIAHQAHSYLRIELSLFLNRIIIGGIQVALNQIEEKYAWYFSQTLMFLLLLTWVAHIYLAYKHR